MQAVILAGGLGTRLRPLTEVIPKPMVEINGRPFLTYLFELLKSRGFTDYLLLVCYKGEVIQEYYGSGGGLGVSISYSVEPKPLGTGGALKNAQGHLNETFLLVNGDTYLRMDYQSMIQRHASAASLGTVAAYENKDGLFGTNLAVSADGLITAYSKEGREGMTHVDAGAVVLNKKALDYIAEPGRVCSLEEEVFPLLISAGLLKAFPVKERFYDIGSFSELDIAKDLLH